ncbi:gamma-glutamyl-gamma-aminobutyrate hydrolase family protein [Devosia aquimaris]|uniref:gamma-glutamyl-gamma-aminobutyrate hydrolase family protein n=1 Tax=Devosia aquimaris TaxID=2866214 RepID=UPI001CD075F8|nr:gamma-glutamyl-gamma-aminobutyrate hydrolase family protein [Devosia sp. CJK-A8-3]
MTQTRPVIGVMACARQVEGESAQTVKLRYLEGVSRYADAAPVIVPSFQDPANAAAIVARMDAVLLTGSSSNIDPARYASSAPAMAPTDAGRDGFSAALVQAAVAAGKPVFGICRGLQEINVAFGGTLRDMRGTAGATTHHAPDDADLANMFAHAHDIDVIPDSPLARYAGAPRLRVNSVHFQAIDRLGDGLTPNATSADGIIEAISATHSRAPVFAVQWHPEWQPDDRPHDLAFWNFLGQSARTPFVPA